MAFTVDMAYSQRPVMQYHFLSNLTSGNVVVVLGKMLSEYGLSRLFSIFSVNPVINNWSWARSVPD
jgi:hypothetical protein